MPTTKNISFTYLEYDMPEELGPEDQELISAAKAAAGKAYAPYSRFRVGAALRLESGKLLSGSNVENAAFPSGICAERTVLSYAISNWPDDHPLTLAIAAMNEEGIRDNGVSPCGNCRQVIAEEEMRTGKHIRILLAGADRVRVIESCSNLLPLQFSKKDLTSDHP